MRVSGWWLTRVMLAATSVWVPCSASAVPPDGERVARYTVIAPAPLPHQLDILDVVVRDVRFGPETRTVGEAIQRLLARSGYRLAARAASCPSMPVVASWPLPEVHRTLGRVRLVDALRMLLGETHYLVVDPVHRLISGELRPRYLKRFRVQQVAAQTAAPLELLTQPSVAEPVRAPCPAPLPSTAARIDYGPIERDDELYPIAKTLAQDAALSVQQMMVALFHGNRAAFCHDNMNCLRIGANLVVPDVEILLSQREAHAQVTRHWRQWQQHAARREAARSRRNRQGDESDV